MIVVLATSNLGKLREFEAIGAATGWSFERPERYDSPAEDGTTYEANAAIKARALWRSLAEAGAARAVLGDDSGLEIAALDGRPGLYSARYLAESATWAERRHALLEEVARATSGDRAARFVCALHFVDASGREFGAVGAYDGTIASEERGNAGFSYDPIFLDPETGRTFGELDEAEKNAKSHRARAFAQLVARRNADG